MKAKDKARTQADVDRGAASMKGSIPCDLSTLDGRKAAHNAIERSDLSIEIKAALIGALDAGCFPPLAKGPKGRPPTPFWKQLQKTVEGMLIDRNARRGQQTAEIERLANERNISPKAMWDRIHRPVRKRKET